MFLSIKLDLSALLVFGKYFWLLESAPILLLGTMSFWIVTSFPGLAEIKINAIVPKRVNYYWIDVKYAKVMQ